MAGKSLSLSLVLISALISSANAQSTSTFRDCIASVALMDFTSKKVFQLGLHDLVVREKPEFAELADVNMKLQVALAQSRRMRLGYLLRADPERLTTSRGMVRFTNFEWSKADAAALTQSSVRFEALRAKINRLKLLNQAHPDWPALRKLFADELTQKREYKELLSRMLGERAAATRRLEKCGRY